MTVTVTRQDSTATVTVDGATRTFDVLTSRQRKRTGWGNGSGADASRHAVECIRYAADVLDAWQDRDAGLVRCVGCDTVCSVQDGATVTLAGVTLAVAKVEADRPLQDANVSDVQVPYMPGTVVPACPTCNGRERDRAARGRAMAAAVSVLTSL